MNATETNVTPQAKKRRNRASLSLAELMEMRMQKLRIRPASVVRRSGLSASFVSRLLSGERIINDDEHAQKLAKGIDVEWIDVIRAARNSRALRQEQQTQASGQ